ncbi:MAG: hypothetical protein CL484_01455 [Acidobacteria bacterium]|nr:hypothetical protein [Acidobacteriota bacterium]|tara:strand:- start:89 stop:274 length:186 start_codon:yes stop_codon:yes gene_type:complete
MAGFIYVHSKFNGGAAVVQKHCISFFTRLVVILITRSGGKRYPVRVDERRLGDGVKSSHAR